MIQLNPAQEPILRMCPQYEAFYQVYKSLYPALKENYKLLAPPAPERRETGNA